MRKIKRFERRIKQSNGLKNQVS